MDNTETIQRTWAGIDGVLVINMDKDVARMQEWMQEVGPYFPAERIHRLSAVAGRELAGYGKAPWFTERTGDRAGFWGGTAGCVLSHRRAIEHAKAAGWKRVLILEDDARFSPAPGPEILPRVLDKLKGEYLLYLGCHEPGPYGRCLDAETGLWEIDGALATHAYVLTAGVYDALLAALPTEETVWHWLGRHKAVDAFYNKYMTRMGGAHVYAVLPPMLYQSVQTSSIAGDVGDEERGKLKRMPKPYAGMRGLLHRMGKPLRSLRYRLNSIRTHQRALLGGLPGYRKRTK